VLNRKHFGVDIDLPLESGGAVVGDKVTITLDIEAVKQARDHKELTPGRGVLTNNRPGAGDPYRRPHNFARASLPSACGRTQVAPILRRTSEGRNCRLFWDKVRLPTDRRDGIAPAHAVCPS
jgi:hypothetical protein